MVRIVHIPPSISVEWDFDKPQKLFFFPTTSLSPSEGEAQEEEKNNLYKLFIFVFCLLDDD